MILKDLMDLIRLDIKILWMTVVNKITRSGINQDVQDIIE